MGNPTSVSVLGLMGDLGIWWWELTGVIFIGQAFICNKSSAVLSFLGTLPNSFLGFLLARPLLANLVSLGSCCLGDIARSPCLGLAHFCFVG